MRVREIPISDTKMLLIGGFSIDLYVSNLKFGGNIPSITEIFLKKANFSATC
jgi:hypothetical protein